MMLVSAVVSDSMGDFFAVVYGQQSERISPQWNPCSASITGHRREDYREIYLGDGRGA